MKSRFVVISIEQYNRFTAKNPRPYCECLDNNCYEKLQMDWIKYRVLALKGRLVLPSHAAPDDIMVEERGTFLIVKDKEK